MKPAHWLAAGLLAGTLVPAGVALAKPLSVDVSVDRGAEAVYQPGDALEVEARVSQDAYLIVYDIDAEGYVHLLFPRSGMSGRIEGGARLRLPSEDWSTELVVEGPTGQGYVVAVASRDPFLAMPWYLRPVDARAEEIGYAGGPSDDEEGVTAEGRIVGDPFVAMERIRRRVLSDPDQADAFATSYTSYYVHDRVAYPRYLCSDCHRPGRWTWWDGFDPYYARCSVFDFRVNWGWSWGRPYWFGYVPYYVYVYRSDCPPRFRPRHRGGWHSSWDGWGRWRSLWGRSLIRYKPEPPVGYVPPSKFKSTGRGHNRKPPGFLSRDPGGGGLRRIARAVPTGRASDSGNRRFTRTGRSSSPGARERRRFVGSPSRTPAAGRSPSVGRQRRGDSRPASEPMTPRLRRSSGGSRPSGTVQRPARRSSPPADRGRVQKAPERPAPRYEPSPSRPEPAARSRGSGGARRAERRHGN